MIDGKEKNGQSKMRIGDVFAVITYEKSPVSGLFSLLISWDTWIRTKIHGFKVRRSAVELYPNNN